MKKILLAVAAIALLASCSTNDEVVKLRDNSIQVSTNLGNRLISKTTGDATVALGVFAFTAAGHAYFADNKLSYDGTAWVLDPKQYWPIDNTIDLKFAAYGPFDDANILMASCYATGVAFSFNHAAASVPGTDVIVSPMTAAINNGTKVDLSTFGHALTQLVFKATLSQSSNPTLKVKINDLIVKSADSANYAAGAWSTATFGVSVDHVLVRAGTSDYTVTSSTAAVGSTNVINVIPNSVDDVTARQIYVKATAYKEVNGADVAVGTKELTINVDGATTPYVAKWVMGTQVVYTISLDADAVVDGDNNKKAIEFNTPQVTTWETNTTDDIISL
ncbi:MAG: hypothetical protein SOZ00_06290 [Tidjanibacter sp.]|nr:hypothetical protein [Tidjanibacter sp.]